MSNEIKSSALALHTIRACLYEGVRDFASTQDSRLGSDVDFLAVSEEQNAWLSQLRAIESDYQRAFGDRLKVVASTSSDELNSFLSDEGFTVQLEPFTDPADIGAVGVLHMGVKWEVAGRSSWVCVYDEISGDTEEYVSAMFTSGVTYFKASGHPYPIAEITTNSEDRVFVTLAEAPLAGLPLLEKVLEIQAQMQEDTSIYFLGLEIPKIDLDLESELSEMKDLSIPLPSGESLYYLKELQLQLKFKLNEIGAQTDAAAAASFGIESGPTFLEMNKPFLLWKCVPGLKHPALVAYLAKDTWKDPGTFELNNG